MNPTQSQVRYVMRMELQAAANNVWDNGEVNCERLARNAALAFDCESFLDDLDHWIWELAVDLADEAEDRLLAA